MKPQREPLFKRAVGRWQGILPALGVDALHLTGRNCPCPICGGKDRFRFTDLEGRGTWICTHCGAGHGVQLVMKVLKVGDREALWAIEPHIDAAPARKPRAPLTDDQLRARLQAMWDGARPVTLEDPAGRYLNARTGATSFPPTLRFAPRLKHQPTPASPATYWPGLLAKMVGPDGKPCLLQRTFLDGEHGKAPVEPPRLMAGRVAKGGAVRLAAHNGTLGIAEGVETAISSSKLFKVPVWAALDAGALSCFDPPAGVTTLIILGDHDEGFAGQEAAFRLARRMAATRPGLHVDVQIPPNQGEDWNDVHARITCPGDEFCSDSVTNRPPERSGNGEQVPDSCIPGALAVHAVREING